MGLDGGGKSSVADQLAGIEASAPMSYDQARARRTQSGHLAINYRTERPVVATYVIEYLWQRLSPRLEEFELQAINENLDTIGQIFKQIHGFLMPMVREIVDAMARDSDPKIAAYFAEHTVFLEMTAMPLRGCPACEEGKIIKLETPSENIISNLLDGNRVVWSLIELVANKLLMDLVESGSLTSDSLDGMQRDFAQIIDGEQFLRFVLKIGLSGSLFENAFLNAVVDRVANENTLGCRNVLDPSFFELDDNRKVLKMREGVRERVMAVYARWQAESLVHGVKEVKGCPAGSAKVDGSNVMVEFIKWLIEIAKRYYIPAYISGVKGEMRARSA